MARVLKIACGLMGVLLLVMVGMMESVRSGDHTRTAMLLRDEGSFYYWGLPNNTVIFPLKQRDRGLVFPFGFMDGWCYYYGDTNTKTSNVYRFKLTGQREKILSGVYISGADSVDVMLEPITKSLLYLVEEPGFQKLYQAQLDGSHPHNLTPDYLNIGLISFSSPRVSPDGKRIYFQAQTHNESERDIYVADLQTGQTQRLTSADQITAEIDYWPQDENWFVANGDGLWQYAANVITPRRLTFSDPDVSTYAVAWNRPAQRLVVVAEDSQGQSSNIISGLSIQDAPEVMWSISYDEYIGSSPDGEWVFVTHPSITDDSIAENLGNPLQVERIEVRTGERKMILQLLNPSSRVFFYLSTDGKWLLGTNYHTDAGLSLMRLNLQTLSYDFLNLPDGYLGGFETSPDGQYVEFYNRDSNSTIIVHLPTATVREIRGKWISTWFTLPETHLSSIVLLCCSLTLILTPILITPLRHRFHSNRNTERA